jgi:phosphoheptose isomerase
LPRSGPGSLAPTGRRLAALLIDCLQRDATLFACGNGGSAAIANHLQCDCQKGIHIDTGYHPKVVSLSSNSAVITAVSNDIGFADCFAFPLGLHGRSGDLLITISSSGNSENIVRALQKARQIGMHSIAMSGFDGGRSRDLATASIHVKAHNYGVVEDVHQSCMHILAQYVRQAAMAADLVAKKQF